MLLKEIAGVTLVIELVFRIELPHFALAVFENLVEVHLLYDRIMIKLWIDRLSVFRDVKERFGLPVCEVAHDDRRCWVLARDTVFFLL